ncbi:MAG: hypothetical protein AB8B83_04395 [Bdellovibrionales bacterium]
MKLLKLAIFGLFLSVALQTSNTAQAALSPFTYTGNNVLMNPVVAGETGTIGNIGNIGRTIISQISGTLPANSLITFTYNFSGDLDFGYLSSTGGYNFTDGGSAFTGFATGNNATGSNAAGFVNGSPSTALAVASAQVDFTNNTATAVIQNNSSGAVDYLNLFVGLVTGSRDLVVSYNVSAVPVPAALPLFGGAILGLMGFSHRRKKALAAA